MNLRLFTLLYRQWWTGTSPAPPYKHVVQIGDPVLRQVAESVNPALINSRPIQLLFQRVRKLMKKTGAAGLAAPQIGVSLRVFAIQFPEKKKYSNPAAYDKLGMQPIPFQIWVNPVMKVVDYTKVVGEECCESMKGFAADLPRYNAIHLSGLDETGAEKQWEASGWSARLVQHEMDHLNGKLFIDSMIPQSLVCTYWDAINHHQGRIYTTYIPNR